MAQKMVGAAPSGSTDQATKGYVDALLASPTFTGTPAAPTASVGTNTTQLATTAFVQAAELMVSNAQTSAYTLVLADSTNAVDLTSATGVAVTIPPNSSVAFPVGTVIEIAQQGAGQLTITAGSGVTLHSAGTLVKTRVQYSTCSIRQVSANTWLLAGDLA